MVSMLRGSMPRFYSSERHNRFEHGQVGCYTGQLGAHPLLVLNLDRDVIIGYGVPGGAPREWSADDNSASPASKAQLPSFFLFPPSQILFCTGAIHEA
jgi:hypothetical protein